MLIFRKINSGDVDLNRVQDNCDLVFGDIAGRKIVDGALLTGINIVTTGTNVSTKLGKKPSGWIVTRKYANVDVWEDTENNILPDTTVFLKSTSNATIDLWVF